LTTKYVPTRQIIPTINRVKKVFFALFFSSLFVFNHSANALTIEGPGPTYSQTPKVTLSVVDNVNPTTPILIAPSNNSYLTNATPTFIWEESTDDRGISKYQFYLNGSLVYDNLPTGNAETSNYIYSHDILNGEYNLQLKNALSDGSYTWKVRVYDINGNFTDSATWSFVVDTLAPNFVITAIGDATTSISAQDTSTVPSSPIELDNNEPLIVATGEANSTVEVTVTIPGDPTQYYTTTIDANGDWELQLGVFERGEVITLDFIITDQAGLVSVINDVQFIVKKIVIVIPPTQSPSPTPTPLPSPTPSPGIVLAPILISPTNGQVLTDPTPLFKWRQPSGSENITHYQFFLNDQLYIEEIVPNDHENDFYRLTYNPVSDEYNLELKENLPNGTYQWKIKVFDNNDTTSESVTWTFTIGPVQPSPSPTAPILEFEITPPRETLVNVIQEVNERLPKPVRDIIDSIPEEIKKSIRDLAPISAAVVATALPVATAFAIASQFGGSLSLQLFLRLLQSLGLLPVGKPQGLVFNSKTYEPVPFALLTIQSDRSNSVQTTETVVTDVNGVYRGIKLSPGLYYISVIHQDFTFPTENDRPPYIQFKDYYKGEVFKVESEKQKQLFLIPVDPKEETSQKRSLKTKLRIFLSTIGRLTQHLTIPLFFISGLLALLFPSLWNTAIFGLYLILVLHKFAGSLKRPIITGDVVDQSGKPLKNVVVRIIAPETNELVSVITTNQTGRFKIYASKGIYLIEVNLPGYIWSEAAQAMSSYQIDASAKTQHIPIVMQSADDIYKNLFEPSK
jgi:hypothetical protein